MHPLHVLAQDFFYYIQKIRYGILHSVSNCIHPKILSLCSKYIKQAPGSSEVVVIVIAFVREETCTKKLENFGFIEKWCTSVGSVVYVV